KFDEEANEEEIIKENRRIINKLQEDAPHYHTRAMRINYLRTCDLLLPKAKSSSLRTIYRMLTSDVSAAETTDQTKIDERIKIALDLRDPEIAVDLRKAADAITAVDERRHDLIMHLATAISVNDLLRQIEKKCLTRTPIPSAQWLRLQFWPKNPTQLSSLQFTGRLPLKFMVQTHQLCAYHQDTHYASALYRYEKEFAHRCKVREPEFPIAAVERGKKVVVSRETTFAVANYDYTKTGIILSITIICNILESINEDFYTGKVRIGLKDLIFQLSSPLRHATELYNILLTENLTNKPILCLYMDSDPDHHCTYTHVQLSYICLFLALDLDYFVAVRTPPQHSWKNPVEPEKLISKVGTMSEICKIDNENNDFKDDLIESLQALINLICDVFSHQSLKGELFETFNAVSEIEIEKFWEMILLVDDDVPYENFTAADIKQKKCGESSCTICRSPRCSPEDFEQLHCLPDPVPGDDLHYKSFEDIYGIRTTENHRPSLIRSETKTKTSKAKIKHTMPFSPSAAHAKNVGVTVNCTECEKPRLLFSAKKLSEKDKTLLRRFLDTIFYTCSMSFHYICDLAMVVLLEQPEVEVEEENIMSSNEEVNQNNINKEDKPDQFGSESSEEDEPDENEEISSKSAEESDENVEESDTHGEDLIHELFSRVFINDSLSCNANVEKPYYSAGIYSDVCIECGCLNINRPAKNEHPHCSDCGGNSINPKKSSMKAKGNKNK
ncbi:7401_t:CDS:2, partial [Scutellospora calospora]